LEELHDDEIGGVKQEFGGGSSHSLYGHLSSSYQNLACCFAILLFIFFKRFLRSMKDFMDKNRTLDEMSDNSKFFGGLGESAGVLMSSTEIQHMDEADFVEREGASN
jgi:hypothetical protein